MISQTILVYMQNQIYGNSFEKNFFCKFQRKNFFVMSERSFQVTLENI